MQIILPLVREETGRPPLNRIAVAFIFALCPALVIAGPTADRVLVDKSEGTMTLYAGEFMLGLYFVSFGANPEGHKQQEGDERTPEGVYTLDAKNADSAFYKAIHISYPNEDDKRAAATRGVDPGGAIMIHGQRNGFGWLALITQRFNWTDGCIAVTNSEIDEIWKFVPVGTPIEIRE